MELIETPQRHTNLQKPLDILTIPKAKFNLAFKMKRTPKSLLKLNLYSSCRNTLEY